VVLFAVGAWLIFIGATLVAVRFVAAAIRFLLLLSTVGVGVLIYAAHSLL
jgi:hypothetical protein